METVATIEVEAAVICVDSAEGKGEESVPEKKASRKSQHKQEAKELCTGRICRRAKLSCCRMCPCQHKRECPIGMQQETKQEEMAKPGGKTSKSSQALVVEAMQIVGDPVQRTETKRKTRTVEAGGNAEVEQDEFEAAGASTSQTGNLPSQLTFPNPLARLDLHSQILNLHPQIFFTPTKKWFSCEERLAVAIYESNNRSQLSYS